MSRAAGRRGELRSSTYRNRGPRDGTAVAV